MEGQPSTTGLGWPRPRCGGPACRRCRRACCRDRRPGHWSCRGRRRCDRSPGRRRGRARRRRARPGPLSGVRPERAGSLAHRGESLAVGAVAVAVGTAIGAALPSTSTERRVLRPATNQAIEAAEQKATDALDQAEQRISDATSGSGRSETSQGRSASSSSTGSTSRSRSSGGSRHRRRAARLSPAVPAPAAGAEQAPRARSAPERARQQVGLVLRRGRLSTARSSRQALVSCAELTEATAPRNRFLADCLEPTGQLLWRRRRSVAGASVSRGTSRAPVPRPEPRVRGASHGSKPVRL